MMSTSETSWLVSISSITLSLILSGMDGMITSKVSFNAIRNQDVKSFKPHHSTVSSIIRMLRASSRQQVRQQRHLCSAHSQLRVRKTWLEPGFIVMLRRQALGRFNTQVLQVFLDSFFTTVSPGKLLQRDYNKANTRFLIITSQWNAGFQLTW